MRFVILDDDPTGIQTVHGCMLITDINADTIHRALTDDVPFFYILTNTRAMTREDAENITRKAMREVIKANEEKNEQLVFISRSDSCLRGHFPLETDVMADELKNAGINVWPKQVFCPAFIEAGRFTIDGTHYMKEGERLVPVSETEFANDNVFAYKNSVLTEYIKEKGANPDDYVIVNARDYDELNAFRDSFVKEIEGYDGAVVIRSSSSLPKSFSGIADKPLLTKDELQVSDDRPGCFIVGSHVKKTTTQLNHLLECDGVKGVELSIERILESPDELMTEVLNEISNTASQHLTPVVFTERKEVRIDDADKRQHLGQTVSDFLVDIVRNLPYKPSYLIAKGGITSHDILTHGLNVKYARVMGQLLSAVPCIMTDTCPYVIFPGNVGNETALKDAYIKLK